MKTLLEPYPIEVEDSSCGNGLQYDKKALFEVIVSSNNLKDQEYVDIFSALLRMSESNYKAIRFCKYSRNPNFYLCYYLRRFRGWQCPCEHYAFDEEKAKKYIEEIKAKNITFWYSDMK